MRIFPTQMIMVLGTSALLSMGCNGDKDDTEFEGDDAFECEDGADNDLDGDYDCDDSDCWSSPACMGGDDTGTDDDDDDDDTDDTGSDSQEDADGDGYSPADGDCDDNDRNVNPGEDEICNNKDDDCNGSIDDDPSDGAVYYEDWDSDGYGDPDVSGRYCDDEDAAAASYIDNSDDCNDVDGSIYPGAPETSDDGKDSNCDGYDLNLESCVAESVEDALNYVSYWSYSVADDSGSEYFGAINWYIYNQLLHVEGASTSVSATSDALEYDVNMGTTVAMNDYYNPYYVEVDDVLGVLGGSAYCYGWIDWTSLPFVGDVELIIDGSNVTGYADLSAATSITESDITLESLSGGSCELSLIDIALDYAGYGGLLDFQLENINTVVDALASELEDEVEWYVDFNCTE